MRRFSGIAIYVATFDVLTAAAIIAVALMILGDRGDPDSPKGPTVRVVVASQSIPAGTVISEEMVTVVDVEDADGIGYVDTRLVVGKVARVRLAPGEKVTLRNVGILSDFHPDPVLPNLRTMMLKTDQVTTEGKYLVPGDHIDIMLERDGEATTVAEGIEILAVATSVQSLTTEQGENPGTITVAVTPQQALSLALALETDGKFRLSRSM